MDLEELRAFVAVADTGSHLAAAESVGMSRSTLRRKVDALEARAGVALLEATSRGVVLTDAGRALASQARQMMQEMQAVLASVRELGAAPSGTLRVVLPVGAPPQGMLQIFAAMRAAHPALSHHYRSSADPVREPLEDVDLAVHFDEDPPGKAWVSFPILHVRRWLLAAPAYLLARGTPTSAEALAQHELLVWQAPGQDPLLVRLRDGSGVPVHPRLIASDIHMIHQACQAGLGIAYVPDAMLPEFTGGPPLVPVLEELVQSDMVLRVSVPKALSNVPKIRMVLDGISAFFATD